MALRSANVVWGERPPSINSLDKFNSNRLMIHHDGRQQPALSVYDITRLVATDSGPAFACLPAPGKVCRTFAVLLLKGAFEQLMHVLFHQVFYIHVWNFHATAWAGFPHAGLEGSAAGISTGCDYVME